MANNKNITFDQLQAAMTKVKKALDGKANSSHGTHVAYSATTPLVAGTGAVGTANNVARGDHVHPAQTSVSGSSGSCTGNAATATKLQTARTISVSGAVSGSTSFDGSGNSSIATSFKVPTTGAYWNGGAMVIRNDGIAEAGKYIDFHNTSASTNDYDLRLQVNNANRNVVTLPGATGTLALTTDNVASATKLQTARKIGNASFNGTADISLNAIMGRAVTSSSSNTYAGQYTKFATINVSAGPYTACCGKFSIMSGESNKVQGILDYYFRTESTITSTTIELYWSSLTNELYQNTVFVVKTSNGVFDLYYKPLDGWETTSITNINCATPDLVTLYSNQGYVRSITEIAVSTLNNYAMAAYKLQTARSINGTSFDGSSDITTSTWGTPRTLTIGNTGKSVNGSGNVSWSLREIGALSTAGGTITGGLCISKNNKEAWLDIGDNDVYIWNASSNKSLQLKHNGNLIYDEKIILNNSNYTNYTVNKTGSGASGTWGIGVTGNAGTATKLQTARTIALSGDVTGSTSFDGSANKTITCTVNTLTKSDLSTIVSNALGVTI